MVRRLDDNKFFRIIHSLRKDVSVDIFKLFEYEFQRTFVNGGEPHSKSAFAKKMLVEFTKTDDIDTKLFCKFLCVFFAYRVFSDGKSFSSQLNDINFEAHFGQSIQTIVEMFINLDQYDLTKINYQFDEEYYSMQKEKLRVKFNS